MFLEEQIVPSFLSISLSTGKCRKPREIWNLNVRRGIITLAGCLPRRCFQSSKQLPRILARSDEWRWGFLIYDIRIDLALFSHNSGEARLARLMSRRVFQSVVCGRLSTSPNIMASLNTFARHCSSNWSVSLLFCSGRKRNSTRELFTCEFLLNSTKYSWVFISSQALVQTPIIGKFEFPPN